MNLTLSSPEIGTYVIDEFRDFEDDFTLGCGPYASSKRKFDEALYLARKFIGGLK